jgi:hypothetical protein
MAVKHRYSIVCDDVRREDNGKLMLVGVYGGTIVVPQFPAVLPTLTIFSVFDTDRPESSPFTLTIQRLENGQGLAQVQGFANIAQPGMGVIPFKFSQMPFQEAGTYSAVLQISNAEPIVVVDFEVALPPQGFGLPQNPFQRR